MFLIFVILFTGIFLFSLHTRKYNNPYKLCFIFGKKGAGKSTLMVHNMLKDLKRGWTVYTDIQDVNIPGSGTNDSSSLEL